MSNQNKFEFTSKQKRTFLLMMAIGLVCILIGIFAGNVSGQRFWSNLLLNSVFFTGIAACAIFFIAAHQIAVAGWYVTVKRIPEAMTQFTKFGAIFILVIVIGTAAGYHHLYHWSDSFIKEENVTQEQLDAYILEHGSGGHHQEDHPSEEVKEEDHASTSNENIHFVSSEEKHHKEEVEVNEDGTIVNPYYDKILDGKDAYLNPIFFIIRAIVFLGLWIFFARQLRRMSLEEDLDSPTQKWFLKSKFWASIFLVVWGVTSSMMAWDWVMSLDPHWYSTLFGWYNFVSLWIASICTTILLLIYLKSKGYMPQLNENHLHDLGKYAFGFSVFWTYLWFDQFMLIWYANLPEETAWYIQRKKEMPFLFWGNFIVNFFVPFLVLMRRDAKRSMTVLTIVCSILIIGHWNDFFVMIMPSTLSVDWAFGYFEIGMFIFFAGMFLYTVFYELAKASLIPQNHPFYKESLDHHI